jgi:hypothetical protein
MPSKRVLRIAMLAAGVFLWTSAALPQQSFDLHIGESVCLELTYQVGLYAFDLAGDFSGAGSTPVLSLAAGCNWGLPSCNNNTCEAIVPPIWPSDFVYVVDGHYPGGGYYQGWSDCLLDFKVYWVHDNYWTVEIFTLCDGCFCFTFEDQMAVELSSPLSAVAGDGKVTLRWTTASEWQNDRFEISRDGARMGSVAGLGNSTTGQPYRWTDETVRNGVTYTYALESVDFGGARHVLGEVTARPSAETAEAIRDYRLYQNYPNPFNPMTRITFDVPSKTRVTLKVYDLRGTEVATLVNGEIEAGRHLVEFDGTKLASGLYLCSMRTGEGFSATGKMLLVK